MGTSLLVQGLRFHIPNAGGLGLIPGTRSHTLQLRAYMLQLKILHVQQRLKIPPAATKIQCHQNLKDYNRWTKEEYQKYK